MHQHTHIDNENDGENMHDHVRKRRRIDSDVDVNSDQVAASDVHARPPPPPSLDPHPLRLEIRHSSSHPASNLLPPQHTLALVTATTSIGRDRSYTPRIRLKSLEVSKTHATLFFDDIAQGWCVCDSASTHGTFVRRLGEQWERLSEKGRTSLPRLLRHME